MKLDIQELLHEGEIRALYCEFENIEHTQPVRNGNLKLAYQTLLNEILYHRGIK